MALPSLHTTLLLPLLLNLASALSLTFTGSTLVLNDIPYYVPATPYTTISFPASLKSAASAGGLVPVTVVSGVSASNSSLSTLEDIIGGFESDDVWSEGFLEGMFMNHRLHV